MAGNRQVGFVRFRSVLNDTTKRTILTIVALVGSLL